MTTVQQLFDRPFDYDDLPRVMSLMTGDEKHDAAATSTLDVLWVLYDGVLDVAPETLHDPARDRFYLSKGHGPMAYYAILAAKGFFPETWLADWATYDSPLGQHPDRNLVPGVEISSGSLGHGLPLAVGTALGLRAQGLASRVVVLVGDAELDEGSNHEAIELAGALGLSNLTVVVVDNASSTYNRDGLIERRFANEDWVMRDARATFARTAADLVEDDLSVALVYAEISGQYFGDVERAHPDRVVNVGIREQLLVNVGAGLALSGMRPIVHTFASFLVERAFEQIKLGFNHQDVGGVLVGSGGSFDASASGRTHQAPGDVALLDTLPGWTVHTPGHADEVESSLRQAVAGNGRDYVRVVGQQNRSAFPVQPGRFHVVRSGREAALIAVGPMLDPVLAATEGLDVTVLYANTIRPFDSAGLRAAGAPSVVLVEPYLAGTSTRLVNDALADLPHRVLSLRVRAEEVRHYGTPAEHIAAHGLDAAGIRASVTAVLGE